jgi:hypothetical protein
VTWQSECHTLSIQRCCLVNSFTSVNIPSSCACTIRIATINTVSDVLPPRYSNDQKEIHWTRAFITTLQQNVEIPETCLIIHPVIQWAVEQVCVPSHFITGWSTHLQNRPLQQGPAWIYHTYHRNSSMTAHFSIPSMCMWTHGSSRYRPWRSSTVMSCLAWRRKRSTSGWVWNGH